MLAGIDGVADVVTVTGYSFLDGLAKSNSRLRHRHACCRSTSAPTRGRASSRRSRTAMRQGAAIRAAQVFAFNLPPIIGLGTGSGFEYQLLDLEGRDPADLAAVAGGLIVAANQDPRLGPTFTTFSAASPQLYLDLDRERLQALGVSVSDLFATLQGTLGSIYVNDFNLFGRTWQVHMQARRGRPRRGRRHRPHPRPQRHRRDGAGRRGRARRVRRRPAVDRPLQQLPLGDDERRPGARRRLRRGARRDGGDLGRDAAARLRLRVVRHRAAGARGRRPDHDRPRARARLRLPVPRRASTRAGRSRSRCCSRSPSASPARSPRCSLAGLCRSTSTPRSASSC